MPDIQISDTITVIIGKNIMKLIEYSGAQHQRPNFSTYSGHSALTAPDIIL